MVQIFATLPIFHKRHLQCEKYSCFSYQKFALYYPSNIDFNERISYFWICSLSKEIIFYVGIHMCELETVQLINIKLIKRARLG